MGKFLRLKNLVDKIKNGIKNAVNKVVMPTLRWTASNAPKILNVIIKMIETADKTGLRRFLIALIPEAGAFVNMGIDILIELSKNGLVDKASSLLQQVLDKKISFQDLIEKAKEILKGGKEMYDKYNNQIRELKQDTIAMKALPNYPEEIDFNERIGNALDVFGASVNQ